MEMSYKCLLSRLDFCLMVSKATTGRAKHPYLLQDSNLVPIMRESNKWHVEIECIYRNILLRFEMNLHTLTLKKLYFLVRHLPVGELEGFLVNTISSYKNINCSKLFIDRWQHNISIHFTYN